MVVGDIIRRTAYRFPEKVGFVFDGREYTWREVNERVNRLANGLTLLGLEKGDRIAVLARSSNVYMELYCAAAKAGFVFVPVNTWLKAREVGSIVADSRPRALLVDAPYESIVAELDCSGIEFMIGLGAGHRFDHDLVDIMTGSPATEPAIAISESDLYALAYTSGTTGMPKGVMITHRTTCAAVVNHVVAMSLRPHHVFMIHAPMFFLASGANRFNAILAGCRCIITTSDIVGMLDIISREKVTHFTVSPTVAQRLLAHPGTASADLQSIEFIGGTGAPFSLGLVKSIVSSLGPVWHNIYGASETNLCTCLFKEDYVGEGGENRLASVGRPGAFCDFRIVDEDGRAIATDGRQTGEIIVRGDAVTPGYWNDPSYGDETIRDGWFYTGDLATRDSDGFVYVVGRRKDMIISGGVNIYPSEIEELIMTHPAVAECAVIGVPSAEWVETPKAIVMLKPGGALGAEELIAYCRDNLAPFKKPTSVNFVSEFPRTATGKIRKGELRAMWDASQAPA